MYEDMERANRPEALTLPQTLSMCLTNNHTAMNAFTHLDEHEKKRVIEYAQTDEQVSEIIKWLVTNPETTFLT